MTPASLLEVLQKPGGLAALAIAAMAFVFRLFKSAMDARINDLKAQLAETSEALKSQLVETGAALKTAQERETAALRTVIPLVEKLLLAISVLEAKNRRRSDAKTEPSPPVSVAK